MSIELKDYSSFDRVVKNNIFIFLISCVKIIYISSPDSQSYHGQDV